MGTELIDEEKRTPLRRSDRVRPMHSGQNGPRTLLAMLLHAVRHRIDGTLVLWPQLPSEPERRILLQAGWVVGVDPDDSTRSVTEQVLPLFAHRGELVLYPETDLRSEIVDFKPLDPYPLFIAATRFYYRDDLAQRWFAALDPFAQLSIRETGELHRLPFDAAECALFDRLRQGRTSVPELLANAELSDERTVRLLHLLSTFEVLDTGSTEPARPSIDELTARAKSLAARGESTAALVLLDDVLQQDPTIASIWVLCGELLMQRDASAGTARKAMRALRRALALQPGHAMAHLQLGRLWNLYGDHKRAGLCLKRAVELDPTLATQAAAADPGREGTWRQLLDIDGEA